MEYVCSEVETLKIPFQTMCQPPCGDFGLDLLLLLVFMCTFQP